MADPHRTRRSCRSGEGPDAPRAERSDEALAALGIETSGAGETVDDMRRESHREVWLAVLPLMLAVGGCAQGGAASPDAGQGPRDSGIMVRVDSGGTMPLDGSMGHDAGGTPSDGGSPLRDSGPPPGCTVASECDDGLQCNGAERCELNRCRPGTPLTCDDGVSCTRDRCVEPGAGGGAATCDYVPDSALCPAGQSCDRASGCSSACAESPCRLISRQCGCGAGLGCYLNGPSRTCATAGSASEGSTCSSFNACVPGQVCLNIARSGSAVSQCSRFCGTDADCAGEGAICIYTLDDGTGGSIPGVRVCSRGCDPVTSAGCSSSASCQIYQENTGERRFFTDCTAPAGPGGQGASCTTEAECRRGFACAGTPGTCLRYCTAPGTTSGCGAFEACFGFTTPLRVGSTEYGVCDLDF